MLRHYMITAWRNFTAAKLQSAIALTGLAIGLTMAILAGIVSVNTFTRDHFVPGYDRLYAAVLEQHNARGDKYQTGTPRDLAGYLSQFPEVESVARESIVISTVLRHDKVTSREKFVWADPNYFRLYRIPSLYGDLGSALERPDGVVITRAMARKYFGKDNAVGQALELNHIRILTVTAVIPDWPLNASTEKNTVFASGKAAFSRMNVNPGQPHMSRDGSIQIDGITLVRLAPGASPQALDSQADALLRRFSPGSGRQGMHFERTDALNLSSRLYPGALGQLVVVQSVALMILILSGVNFASLSAARSTQRGREVAIRKVTGAGRGTLIVQFLGESVLQILFALCLSAVLVEWSLPAVNAYLESGAVFDYWRDPTLLAALISGALLVGLLAAFYPALVLSALRPAAVVSGGQQRPGGAPLRLGLVMLQFAALIIFLISAGTVFRQNQYVTNQALGVDTSRTVLIHMPKCDPALQTRIAALPGVKGAACSSIYVFPDVTWGEGAFPHGSGPAVDVSMVPVDAGYFELYGLDPVAGRFFRPGRDAVPPDPSKAGEVHYVINQEAMRRLGFASANAAIGQPLNFPAQGLASAMPGGPPDVSRFNGVIIGVVKDFSFTPDKNEVVPGSRGIPPMIYSVGLPLSSIGPLPAYLHVKLDSGDMAPALAAIDEEWKKSAPLDPIDRQSLDEIVQAHDATILRQGEAFAAFAVIAMLLACLGLLGVALSTAARRIKEIGIRKAMGARDRDILALLLWQFAKPVLWANLIAWPLAWWAMKRWLSDFAYHVDLAAWMFPAAGIAALLIAFATIAGQLFVVTRQRPVLALRTE